MIIRAFLVNPLRSKKCPKYCRISTVQGLILLALHGKGRAEAASLLPQASPLLLDAEFVAGWRG